MNRPYGSIGTDDAAPTVSGKLAISGAYGSVHELAADLPFPVFSPSWWPRDAGPIAYQLDQSASGPSYRIAATRSDETPICIIGGREDPHARLPTGDWRRLPQLEPLRGLVTASGAYVRAVVHDEGQIIHLIGYASEDEVVRAIRTFSRVSAE